MKKNGKVSLSPAWGWQKKLKIMKWCVLLTCLSVMQAVASGYSQEVKLDLQLKDASLARVMSCIREQSEFSFFFDDAAIGKIANITLDLKNASVDQVMSACLKGTGFSFRVIDKTIILYRENHAQQEQVKECVIKGKVTNERNQPMPGVTIRVEGTTVGVASDKDGNFVLRLPVQKGKLIFTFIGYKGKTVAFNGTTPIHVKLEEDVAALDEVQVVAYGEQKKRTVISAISSVKADDIKELPTHSLESLLQGHMAGVQVNNMSGAPGGGGSIVSIRGYNSFFVEGEGADGNYGTPLYVVDGVPMQAFTSPITGTNTLSDIDPAMIESIEVLKDAASSAIYGSRAGNGVILITTKKGRAGQAKFTANASYSASWLPETPVVSGGRYERNYHMQGLINTITPYLDKDNQWKMPSSYEEVYNWGKEKYGPEYNYFWGDATNGRNAYQLQDSLNPFYNNSTDWWRYAYRTAKVWNANLQASGGTELMRYMIGAGYYKEEGIMLNTGYQRANVMTNLDVQATKHLKINNQLSFTYTDRSRGGSGRYGGSKVEGLSVNPTRMSSLLPGGSYVEEKLLEDLNSVTEKNHGYSARYNLVLDYEIIKNMHFRITGGLDFSQQNMNHFRPSTLDTYKHYSRSKGSIGRNLSIQNENLLTYDFSFQKKHNFNVLLGLSFSKDQMFANSGEAINGPNDHVQYVQGQWGDVNGLINDGKQSAFIYGSNFEEQRMSSYFGRLRYNYQEKYLLEATIRRDGSSVFGENVRWATFPSVAAGWAFSQESFMKDLYWLSFGKIRLSWGKSGQQFRQPYLAQGLMTGAVNSFLGQVGQVPNTTGGVINPLLSWQETSQYDFGLDVSFLDYRLKLTLDYYYRYTKGQLSKVYLPGNISFHTFQWRNALDVSNEGVEMELTADFFRETAVKWRMKVNLSRNWNRFEKSYDGYDNGPNVIGKPLYQIRAFKTEGYYTDFAPLFYQANGMPLPIRSGARGVFFAGTRKIADLNGDGRITDSDKYLAASPLPQAYGGIANEIRWKQFDLNIFFIYSIGRHILKEYDDISMRPSGLGSYLGADVRHVDAWQNANSGNTAYPAIQLYSQNNMQFTGAYDCDIENVHLLRLKQLTLGYNLHEKITRKLGITGARIFLTGENLFLLTNYSGLDPEIVDITEGLDRLASYPLPRKFTVGLTVNF